MAGAVGPDIGDAGFLAALPGFGGNRLQHGFQLHIGLPAAARHQAGSVQGPFFAAADAHADKFHPQFRQLRSAPPGIFKIGITAVNDDIPCLQQRSKGIQHGIHSRPCLDHHDDFPGPFQILHQFFHTVCRLQAGIGTEITHELLCFGSRTVEHQRLNVVVCQITGQVGAHNRQSD